MNQKTKSGYLEYLPAIYQEDPFLGQFLRPFDEVLTGFGDLLAVIDRYFAPALTDADFLPWLATWVALVLDEEWDEAKRRRLIGEAVELYRWRGTIRGLKRYLEIYTGLVPDIREWRWPGGMQVGVASQIGGFEPGEVSAPYIKTMARRDPVEHSYYVVDTLAPEGHPQVPAGQPLRLYYRADMVKEVVIGAGFVDITLLGDTSSSPIHYAPATVNRRDGLLEDHYTLGVGTGDPPETVEYQGNTFLIGEVELPYRFTVDVRVPAADLGKVKLDQVRAIVDLEKPAHTMYYLKLTPMVSRYVLQVMQIGVRSSIGLDTIIG